MKVSEITTEKNGLFKVQDHLPTEENPAAIFAHSYCMTWRKNALAPPTEAVVAETRHL